VRQVVWYEVEVVKAIRFTVQIEADTRSAARKQALAEVVAFDDCEGEFPDFTVKAINRMTDAHVERMLHFGEGGEADG